MKSIIAILFGAIVLMFASGRLLADEGILPTSIPVHINTQATEAFGASEPYYSVSLGTADASGNTILVTDNTKAVVALVPNQVYTLTVVADGSTNASFSVAPPPGYSALLDGLSDPSIVSTEDMPHTVQIVPNKQAAAADAGVASSFLGDHPNWRVSLGRLLDGSSAGWVTIGCSYNTNSLSALFTPSALQYIASSPEVLPFYDFYGNVRQVISDEVCMDVVTVNSTTYTLNFYPEGDVDFSGSGPYGFTSGSYPFISYTISEGTAGTNQVTITSNTYNSSSSYPSSPVRTAVTSNTVSGSSPYTFTIQDWHTSGTTAPVQIVISNAGSADSSSPETVKYEDGSGNVATTRTRLFSGLGWTTWTDWQNFDEGVPALASSTLGTNSSNSVTEDNQYYDDTSATESCGFPMTSWVNGHWVGYEYQANTNDDANDGIISKIHRQYLGSTTTVPTSASALSSDSSGQITSYTYQPDAFGVFSRPTLVETTVGGVITSKSSTSYQGYTSFPVTLNGLPVEIATRTDYSTSNSGSNTLVSQIASYCADAYLDSGADPFYCGKPIWVAKPDGTMDAYVYQRGTYSGGSFSASGLGSGTDSRIAVIHGTTQSTNGSVSNASVSSLYGYSLSPSGASGIPSLYVVTGESTLEVTIRDQFAHVVHTETDVWDNPSSSWVSVQSVDYTYDSLGHHVNSETMSNGTSLSFAYSGEQLSTTTDPTGIVTTYSYDAAGRVSETSVAANNLGASSTPALDSNMSYDGASHVTQVEKTGGTNTSTQTASYDDAGRTTQTVDPTAGTTSYAYAYSSGETTTTITLPNGAERIDTTLADGHLNTESGSGVVSRSFFYTTNSDGTLSTEVYYNYDPELYTSPRYQITQTDLLGRTLEEQQPTVTYGVVYTVQNNYDSTTGLLDYTSRSDGTNSLGNLVYQYDAMAQCITQGVRYGTGASLTLASSDRITQTITDIESFDSNWWRTTKTTAYPWAGSGGTLPVNTVRDRLTGFSGSTIAEEKVTDTYGDTSDTTTTVDTTSNIVTATTTEPDMASSATVETVAGLPIKQTAYDSFSAKLTYDDLWRPSVRTDPRGDTTTTTYQSGSALPYQMKDANGTTIATYAYDSAGELISSENAASLMTYCSYNSLGELTNQWGDVPNPVEYAYDSYGQKTTMYTYQSGTSWSGSTWPSGATASGTTTWTYDDATGLLQGKTEASHEVTYSYNTLGQLTERTLPGGATSSYGYDSYTGELTGVTYGSDSGLATNLAYTYNRTGLLNTVTDATGTHTFNYNSSQAFEMDSEQLDSSFYNGLLLTRTHETDTSDSDGAEGSWTIGHLTGRPNGVELGTSSSPSGVLSQLYVQSNDGRFAGVNAQTGSGTDRQFIYSYDHQLENGYSVTSGISVSRTYDANNLLSSIESTYDGGSAITNYAYAHNNLYQATSVVQSGTAFADYGGTSPSTFQLFTYDNRGELQSAKGYYGGTISNISQPLPDRSFYYTYDAAGNRLSSNYSANSSLKESYTLDSSGLNELATKQNLSVPVSGTIANNSSANVTLQTSSAVLLAGRQEGYWAGEAMPPADSSDHPSNESDPSTFSLTVTAGLPNSPSSGENLTKAGSVSSVTIPALSQSFTYDSNGNMTCDGMWHYAYDAENRLAGMTTTSAAHSVAGLADISIAFTYDYLGRRVEKKVVNTDTSTTLADDIYVYDGWNVIADYQVKSGYNLYRTFAWGLDIAGSLNATGGVGGLLELTNVSGSSTTDYCPTYDGNGNVVSLVNASTGAVAAAYEYSPFGETLRIRSAVSSGTDSNDSAVADNPFRFSTKFTDVNSYGNNKDGLIYYGNRYYSPTYGRFLNQDPSGEQGGINLYGFCGNDSVNGFDVLGYFGVGDPYAPVTTSTPASTGYTNPDSDPNDPQSLQYWLNVQAEEEGLQEENDGTDAALAGIASGDIQVVSPSGNWASEQEDFAASMQLQEYLAPFQVDNAGDGSGAADQSGFAGTDIGETLKSLAATLDFVGGGGSAPLTQQAVPAGNVIPGTPTVMAYYDNTPPPPVNDTAPLPGPTVRYITIGGSDAPAPNNAGPGSAGYSNAQLAAILAAGNAKRYAGPSTTAGGPPVQLSPFDPTHDPIDAAAVGMATVATGGIALVWAVDTYGLATVRWVVFKTAETLISFSDNPELPPTPVEPPPQIEPYSPPSVPTGPATPP